MKVLNPRFAAVLIAGFLVLLSAAGSTSHARTFGLVVGINQYAHLPHLNGAVNDARDIADALRLSGADEVTVLLDADATREAILEHWNDITAKASPGDTVVFSYAGHGGQEEERVSGNEADGLDEVFLLSGFDVDASGNGQRIVDDELNRMFASVPQLKIVFIADSCHSGTMTRNFDIRAGQAQARVARYDRIVDDQLPAPDPAAARLDLERMNHVVFFGAVQDHEVALELPIGGVARGALSWSFARALRGHADHDGDNIVTTQELERYLTEKVRTMSEGRQFPQMVPRSTPTEIALAVPRGDATPAAADVVRLHILGTSDPAALAAALKDTALAPRDKADLVWDTEAGEVVSSGGDIVARPGAGTDTGPIQAIVDKFLLLRDLQGYAETQPLSLRIQEGYGVHRSGEHLSITMSDNLYGHLTLFNLAVDGTVQFLVPWPSHANPAYHGTLRPDRTFEFELKVSEPFGADHLVALTSPDELAGLNAELLGMDATKSAGRLRKIVARHLKGARFQAGYVGLFTAP